MGARNELGGLYKNRGAVGQSPMPFGNYVLNKNHPLYPELVACVATCNGMTEMVTGQPAISETGTPVFNGDNWTFDKASSESIVFAIDNPNDQMTWQTPRGMTLFAIHGRPISQADNAHMTVLSVFDNNYPQEKHSSIGITGYSPKGRLTSFSGRRYFNNVLSAYAVSAYDVELDNDRQVTCTTVWKDAATTFSTALVYQNGTEVGSFTTTTDVTYQTIDADRMRFGYGAASNRGGYFNGDVELGIAFKRALTAEEVQLLSADPYGLIIPEWLANLDLYRRAIDVSEVPIIPPPSSSLRGRGAIGQSPMPFGNYVLNHNHPLVSSGALVGMWASCAGLVEIITGQLATSVSGTPVFNGNEWVFDKTNSEKITLPLQENTADWLVPRGLTLFCISGRPSGNSANEGMFSVRKASDIDHNVTLGQISGNRLFTTNGSLYNGQRNEIIHQVAYTDYADRDRLIYCATHSSDAVRIYENSVLLVEDLSVSAAQTFTVDQMEIGYSTARLRQGHWDSGVEMAMFFNRALTAEEVQLLSADPYGVIIPTWLANLDPCRWGAGATTPAGPLLYLQAFAA